ncbi:hypothetical protein GQ44DRAFT_762420 [Phaeosphaeriaceae sp. PMI808]|nr:hypothetical protein GQ44DRAFT_762420 [Phaeosphaeriaceae sp. PMI808]
MSIFYGVSTEAMNVRICGPGMDPGANKKPDWQNFDDNLALKDAYYNGTASLTARRTGANIECEKTWVPQSEASLAIGDMAVLPSDPKSSRQDSGNATKFMGDSDRFWTIDFKSSTSQFLWGQAWTLNSTKSGDGFDISGRYTTKKLNSVNSLFYQSSKCVSTRAPVINLNWNIVMTGHVSPQSANLKIVMDIGMNDTTALEFSGTLWAAGPKVVVTGSQIATEGMLKGTTSAATVRIEPRGLQLLCIARLFVVAAVIRTQRSCDGDAG